MISCNSFGPMQTTLTHHIFLNFMNQAWKVSCHVYVWYGQNLCLYLQFCNWMIELFRQCGICCFCVRFQNCSDSVELFVFLLDFRIVLTVWYLLFFCQILELFRQCEIVCFSFRIQNCTDSVELHVFSVRFQNCSDSVELLVFLFDFRTVRTVWNCLVFCQILELYGQCGIISFFSGRFKNCSDSIVFFVFLLEFRTVLTVWYLLFFCQMLELYRHVLCSVFHFIVFPKTDNEKIQ